MNFALVLEAFEFSSMGPPGSTEGYFNRETGEYFIVSNYYDSGELPDDLDTDRYLVLPEKRELGLGKRLVLQFVCEHLEEDYDEVQRMFNKKGAYSRFKSLLERRSLLETWYEYERQAQEVALRDWCQGVGIKLED